MRTLFLFLVLAIPCVVHAQFAEDVRLSAIEPLVHNLPDKYRIQSADSAGNRTLVVWGTSRNLSQEEVAGQLRYQILDGATPADTQRALTSDEALPHTYVRVVSLSSRFLVLWLDARPDSAGLYGAVLDSTGAIIYPEFRLGPEIAPHKKLGTRAFVAGTPDEGRLVMWQIELAEEIQTIGKHFNPDGTHSSATQHLGKGVRSTRLFAEYPGMTVIHLSEKSLMINASGIVDDRLVQQKIFDGSWHMGQDTSFICLRKGSIERWTSLFDDEPIWNYPVHHLDSAFPGTAAIGRDSTGSPFFIFATSQTTGSAGEYGWFTLSVWKVPFMDSSLFIPDSIEQLYTRKELNGAEGFLPTGRMQTIRFAWTTIGCDLSIHLTMQIESIRIYRRNVLPRTIDSQYFYLDARGAFRLEGTGIQSICGEQPPVVIRDATGTMLTVDTGPSAGEKIIISSPVASTRSNEPQRYPRLILDNDRLRITWKDLGSELEICAYIGEPVEGPAHLTSLLGIPRTTVYKHLSRQPYVLAGSLIFQSWKEQTSTGPNVISVSNQAIYADMSNDLSPDPFIERLGSVALDVHITIDGQWKKVAEWYPDFGERSFRGEITGYNTAGNTVLGFFNCDRFSRRTSWKASQSPDNTYHFAPDGRLLFTVGKDVISQPGFWMPLDSLHTLVITRDEAIRLQQNEIVARFTLPPSGDSVRVIPLTTTEFLRIWKTDTETLALDIHDTEGNTLASNTLDSVGAPMLSKDVPILQRSSDAAIITVWGTNDAGIHAMLMDRELNAVVHDTIISVTRETALNPAAIFKGDVLITAWEDYRNGNADIYASATTFPLVSLGPTSTTEQDSYNLLSPAFEIR